MSTNCLGARQGTAESRYKIQIINTESESLMKQESLPKSWADDTLAADFNLSTDLAREKFDKKIRLHDLYLQIEESSNNHSFLVTDRQVKSRHFNLSPTIKKHFALINNLNSSTEGGIISIKPLIKNSNVVTKRVKESKEKTCACYIF